MRLRPAALAATLLTLVACGNEGASNKPPSADELRARRAATGFDGQAALGYVKTALDFGFRVPGMPGHSATGDWIVKEMAARGAAITEQRWTHKAADGKTLPLRNILARWNPTATQRVLYLTHWDTRPKQDASTNPALKDKPLVGANDGTSGIGLFLALADVLQKTPPTIGVDLLFVDGEDYGDFNPTEVDVLLGSTYFAANLPSPDYKPMAVVLWDMIGDADLQLPQEVNSVQHAPEVVAIVYRVAESLGYANIFTQTPKWPITDDHIPLQKAGLRAIDIIDIEYPHHHREGDTLDKLSAASLQIVGEVAVAVIREVSPAEQSERDRPAAPALSNLVWPVTPKRVP
jgi:glutaminyl-peptide cyclotransferase